MTMHNLQHGGPGRVNPNQEMYPSANPQPASRLAPAAHKEPIAFGITRMLDFSLQEGRRQAGLQQYLDRLALDGGAIAVGDTLVLSAIPARSLLVGYAYGVEVPEQGVVFDLRTLYSNITVASGINAGTVCNDGGFLPAITQWIPDGDFLVADIKEWPANTPMNLQFWATPIVMSPKIGN